MAQIFLLLLYAVMVGLWATFILLLAYKVGFVEWMQVHGCNIISKMAHCDFCMSWWLCLILSLIVLGFSGDLHILVVPFLATPIARRLL